MVTDQPRWRVHVGEACIAAGSCLALAPHRFTRGADGRSHPTDTVFKADDAVLDAAASCPMEAITVSHAQTGEPIAP